MKKILIFLISLQSASMANSVTAADVGRYQAVPMDGDGPGRGSGRVLIIDTQEGHVWTWSGNELLGDGASGRRYGSAFIYQGKVRPGNKNGEVLDLPAK